MQSKIGNSIAREKLNQEKFQLQLKMTPSYISDEQLRQFDLQTAASSDGLQQVVGLLVLLSMWSQTQTRKFVASEKLDKATVQLQRHTATPKGCLALPRRHGSWA